jgi:hypothetical protein
MFSSDESVVGYLEICFKALEAGEVELPFFTLDPHATDYCYDISNWSKK